MVSMVSRVIPSYFTYQRQEYDDRVVITCLERTLTQDMVRQDKDLYVYADTLTINSALTLPCRKVVINARSLVMQGGSLNVTGGAPGVALYGEAAVRAAALVARDCCAEATAACAACRLMKIESLS